MKLTLRHHQVRCTDALDSLIEERILSLQPRLALDEAVVLLEYCRGKSPAFRVQVHLATPGPDLAVEGCDHTLRAALDKVMAELERRIDGRARQRAWRIRGHRQLPARSRWNRVRP
jgi:ribosomal subunit interface protein